MLVVLFASGAATLVSYFLFAISLQFAESSRIGVVIALMLGALGSRSTAD